MAETPPVLSRCRVIAPPSPCWRGQRWQLRDPLLGPRTDGSDRGRQGLPTLLWRTRSPSRLLPHLVSRGHSKNGRAQWGAGSGPSQDLGPGHRGAEVAQITQQRSWRESGLCPAHEVKPPPGAVPRGSHDAGDLRAASSGSGPPCRWPGAGSAHGGNERRDAGVHAEVAVLSSRPSEGHPAPGKAGAPVRAPRHRCPGVPSALVPVPSPLPGQLLAWSHPSSHTLAKVG